MKIPAEIQENIRQLMAGQPHMQLSEALIRNAARIAETNELAAAVGVIPAFRDGWEAACKANAKAILAAHGLTEETKGVSDEHQGSLFTSDQGPINYEQG